MTAALETGGDLLELAPEERLDFTAVCRSDGAAGMNLTAGMNLPGSMNLPGGTGIRAAGTVYGRWWPVRGRRG